MTYRALVITVLLTACARGDDVSRNTAKGANRDTASVATREPERPVWEFGESSTRTDTLPRELDTLATWGDYRDGERPVAYAVDLNGDGKSEVLVRTRKDLCGPFGGCGIRAYTRAADGRWTQVLDELARDVMVTNHLENGWPVMWTYVGGIDGGVFRLVYSAGEYRQTATLLANRGMMEWTTEQYAADTIWQRIQSVRIP
jgi:hypothetical protein